MVKKYSPHTAHMMVDDILEECFKEELEPILKNTGLKASEYIIYNHEVIEYYYTSYKAADIKNLNTAALDEYAAIAHIRQKCRQMLRKMFLEFPTHKDFINALPLQSNEFTDKRSYDIFFKYKDDPMYKEVEFRLITSKVL